MKNGSHSFMLWLLLLGGNVVILIDKINCISVLNFRLYLTILMVGQLHLLSSQSCFTGGIIFTSQEEIDDFANDNPSCRSLGDVLIKENRATPIHNLEGLRSITSISGSLEINGNSQLSSLQGLDNLKKIEGSLIISGNPSLSDIDALQHLSGTLRNGRIANNGSLANLQGLVGLQSVSGDLTISNNPDILNFTGLENLRFVGQHFIISNNANLRSFSGMDGLLEIGADLNISDNPALQNIAGLSGLGKIGKALIVDHNQHLVNFMGIPNLQSLGGNLIIVNNESLMDVNGLQNLGSIDGILQVYNNPQLRSLRGLDSIDEASIKELAILSSPELRSCSVVSICEYLKSESPIVAIRMNAPGCLTPGEVLNRCSAPGKSSEPKEKSGYLFFPNPTFNVVYIQGQPEVAADYHISDLAGRRVQSGTVTDNSIDISLLSAAMYIIELQYPEDIVRGPVIKIQ